MKVNRILLVKTIKKTYRRDKDIVNAFNFRIVLCVYYYADAYDYLVRLL